MSGFASYPGHRPPYLAAGPTGHRFGAGCIARTWTPAAVAGVLIFLLLASLTSSALAVGDYEDDHLQIELAPGVSIEDINLDYGTTSTDEIPPLHLLQVGPGSTIWDLIDEMANDSRIIWAEPSYINETPEALRAMVVGVVGGTIQDYEDQDVYGRLHLGELHEHATGEGIIIAVLDTGVNASHPAFLGHVLPGYDFVDDDDDPSDTTNGIDDDLDGSVDEAAGHGTMVAGIAHLAAPGAEILSVRVINDDGVGRTFDVVKGIQYAIAHNARILNLSLGLRTPCETLTRGVEMAIDAGMIIVAAAGNDPIQDPPFFPATLAGVHGIAALDSVDVKADFSSYHPTVSVSGPGTGIRGPYLDDGWALGAGTSFAAPFVSGQAAIIAGALPALSKTEADGIVQSGVVDVYQIPGNGPYYGLLGTGRVDGIETWELLRTLADIGSGATDQGSVRRGPHLLAVPNPSPVTAEVVLSVRQPDEPDSRTSLEPPVWTILDVSGRLLRSLAPQRLGDDGWTVQWNGRDSSGRKLPSGLYFVRASDGTVTTRILRVQD